MHIITANLWFGMTWETYRYKRLLPLMFRHGIIPQGQARLYSLPTHVNNGRWLAVCPCGGADRVWEEGVFMCHSCFNAHLKHNYATTAFPLERKAIEEFLIRRPLPNRNWYPSESMAVLEAENETHRGELLEVF